LSSIKGVVVGHARSAEAARSAERREQLGERVALHGGTAVRVDLQAGFDAVTRDGLGEELGGEVLALLAGEHPPDDEAAEKVDDDVRHQEDALLRRRELGSR
jgi:hypothetical protein